MPATTRMSSERNQLLVIHGPLKEGISVDSAAPHGCFSLLASGPFLYWTDTADRRWSTHPRSQTSVGP